MLGIPFFRLRYIKRYFSLFRRSHRHVLNRTSILFQLYFFSICIFQRKMKGQTGFYGRRFIRYFNISLQYGIDIRSIERCTGMEHRKIHFGQGKKIKVSCYTAQRMNGILRSTGCRIGKTFRNDRDSNTVFFSYLHQIRHIQFESRKTT